jgi:hypothetical protein
MQDLIIIAPILTLPICQQVARKTMQLNLLGMSYRQLAVVLGVSWRTVVRAVRFGWADPQESGEKRLSYKP